MEVNGEQLLIITSRHGVNYNVMYYITILSILLVLLAKQVVKILVLLLYYSDQWPIQGGVLEPT